MQIFALCVVRVLDVSILIAEQVHDACNWNILGMCVACVWDTSMVSLLCAVHILCSHVAQKPHVNKIKWP